MQAENQLLKRDPQGGATDGESKLDVIIGACANVLEFMREASEAIPVPAVKGIVGSVLYMLKAVQVQSPSNIRVACVYELCS